MKIGNRKIGKGHPTYIIAEMSCNHCQDYDKAVKLVYAAKKAGADAVKLQTFTPDTITLNSDNKYFQINNGTLWDGQTLYDLYKTAYTPWEWHKPLQKIALDIGLDFFSTPFDCSAVDFLEKEIDPKVYKIASFESMDNILLKKITQTGKPVIMSTGISSLSDINNSIKVLRKYGTKDICLLKCTSCYPAPPELINLRTIKNMRKTFGVHTGLSDHTTGISIPIASVCFGSSVIEKHLILSRNDPSPDKEFSLEPHEFKQMVQSIRKVEKAIGKVQYDKSDEEKKNKKFGRSLFVVKNVLAGQRITKFTIRSIRPGDGLHTKHYDSIIGKRFKNGYKKGTPLSWDMIE